MLILLRLSPVDGAQAIERTGKRNANSPLTFPEETADLGTTQTAGKAKPQDQTILFGQLAQVGGQLGVLLVSQGNLIWTQVRVSNESLRHRVHRNGRATKRTAMMIHTFVIGDAPQPRHLLLFLTGKK